MGLALFDENFEGRTLKNIDSFGKYRPKVVLTFLLSPPTYMGFRRPCTLIYKECAQSGYRCFFCHVLATNRIHVRDVSTKRGIGCSLLSNMF